jgi:hypothetical protein
MNFEAFAVPSSIPAPTAGGFPALAQLKGRLLHIRPTGRQDDVTTPKQPTPHTRLTCEVTFLDGAPITERTDQMGNVVPFTPPIMPGQVMVDMFVSQSYFVRRLKDKVGMPGYPGMVGILGQEPVRGNLMWNMADPSPAQMNQLGQWFAWRNQQGAAAHYVPAPVQVAPPVAPPVAYAPQVPAPAPVGSPFAQPAPVAAPAPVGSWTPTLPPGMAPATAPVAAPAPQPGPDVPPWQR